jgi:hypothetical protein
MVLAAKEVQEMPDPLEEAELVVVAAAEEVHFQTQDCQDNQHIDQPLAVLEVPVPVQEFLEHRFLDNQETLAWREPHP